MSTEYHLTIDEGLKLGIKPYEGNRRNSQFLTEALNVECWENGLLGKEDITDPFTSYPETASYPYPQLFVGKSVTLLAYETAIYSVDTSSGVGSWTASILDIYDAEDTTVGMSIPEGVEPWQFVDLDTCWYLLSSKGIIFKHHKSGLITGGVDVALFSNSFTAVAGCAFNGRIILGGFVPSEVWNSVWQSLFTHWLSQLPTSASFSFDSSIDAPGENWVMWSSIGGSDIPLMFLDVDMVTSPGVLGSTPGYGEDEPYIFQALRRNELGWVPLPFQGSVLALKALSNGVVAYCENGVALLFPVIEPFPTFGIKVLCRVGITDKSAVGGNESIHVFLDTTGNLWTVTAEGAKRLGYKDEFSSYISNIHMIFFDEVKERFYITTGSVAVAKSSCYILTKHGLSGSINSRHLTGLSFYDGSLVGIHSALSVPYKYVLVTTEIQDMKYRGEKVINRVELGISHNNDYDIADHIAIVIYSRSSTDSDFTASDSFYADSYGICNDIRISGVEFKIRVVVSCTTGDATTGFSLDYINVWYDVIDKRFRRGI